MSGHVNCRECGRRCTIGEGGWNLPYCSEACAYPAEADARINKMMARHNGEGTVPMRTARDREELLDMIESAWGIIANAGGGNWRLESKDWQEAAARWRDEYHKHLSKELAGRNK